MGKEDYKYNAFISYRHCDLDKFVAENLHRLVETYIMPKSVIQKYNITDNNVRRLFRDQDELPLASNLETPIIDALKASEFLIVICSPRLKESVWCKKEIENFIEFHGRSHILCVLVEGEPKESFPEILLHNQVKTKTEAGEEIVEEIDCEPLAMDVRGKSKKEIYKNLKTELIRIIAPMYNLDYDDIKQRHEERKLKHKANIFKAVAIASLLFAIYSFFLFSRIYISSKQLKYDQSINLAEKANELLLNDNRIGAIEKAYQSVTKYNNIKMPITAKGIYELTEDLGVYYNHKYYYYPVSQLDTFGVVKCMKTDINKQYLLSYDESGEIVLWNLKDESRIKTVSDTVASVWMKDYMLTFIGDKHYAYINKDKNVIVLDLEGNEVVKIKPEFSAVTINSSKNGKYLEIGGNDKISIYETYKYEQVAIYEASSDMEIINNQYFDPKEEKIIFATTKKDTDEFVLSTYDINEKKILSSITVNGHDLIKLIFKDDNAIALFRRNVKSGDLSGWDMIVTSYNCLNGEVYYQKEFYDYNARNIALTFSEDGEGTILATTSGGGYLLDFTTGNTRAEYSFGDIEVYVQPISGVYRVFTSNGNVNTISGKATSYYDNTALVGPYYFNLPSYGQFLYTSIGYLAFPSNR